MDANFSGMPDAVWLKGILPKAHIALRSNNRDVQARMCASGAGLADAAERGLGRQHRFEFVV